MKFFFTLAVVNAMEMQFRWLGPVPKEELKVPCDATWYEKLLALSNRVFGN
ncbi:hypothetical protein Hanom_Chr03g00202531 [Helianthus anomalus]